MALPSPHPILTSNCKSLNFTKHDWNLESLPQVVLGITINKHCGNRMRASSHVTSCCFCEKVAGPLDFNQLKYSLYFLCLVFAARKAGRRRETGSAGQNEWKRKMAMGKIKDQQIPGPLFSPVGPPALY